MDILPHSVEGAITLFFSVLAALIGGIAKIAQVLRKRDDKKMQSIPPSRLEPISERLDTLERALAVQREWHETDLLRELSELQKTVSDITADMGRMSFALNAERQRAQRAEARLSMELDRGRMLEHRLSESLYAMEKLEHERDAARATVAELRKLPPPRS